MTASRWGARHRVCECGVVEHRHDKARLRVRAGVNWDCIGRRLLQRGDDHRASGFCDRVTLRAALKAPRNGGGVVSLCSGPISRHRHGRVPQPRPATNKFIEDPLSTNVVYAHDNGCGGTLAVCEPG